MSFGRAVVCSDPTANIWKQDENPIYFTVYLTILFSLSQLKIDSEPLFLPAYMWKRYGRWSMAWNWATGYLESKRTNVTPNSVHFAWKISYAMSPAMSWHSFCTLNLLLIFLIVIQLQWRSLLSVQLWYVITKVRSKQLLLIFGVIRGFRALQHWPWAHSIELLRLHHDI